MPEMFACFTNAGDGGKTRFSCSTDSIVDAIRSSSVDQCLSIESPNRQPVKISAIVTIKKSDLIQSVADALQFISYYHPADYLRALGRAYEREHSSAAKAAIAQILTNARMCAEGHRPICQDTGIVNVFLKVGMGVRFDFDGALEDAVNEGVRRAYLDTENPLRASILGDVLGDRK